MTEKIIIVAIDFSPAAANAARYASDLAAVVDAKLVLLHVYQPAYFNADIPVVLNDEELMIDTKTDLLSLKEELTKQPGAALSVETMVKVGAFYQELFKVCEIIEPYAVVMSSHGKTAAQQLLFGSHTTFAMRHLPHPLIAVHENTTFRGLKKIGLACDIEFGVDDVPVGKIKSLVTDLKASLHILSVGKQTALPATAAPGADRLRQLLADVEPSFHFVSSGDVDEALVSFAMENRIDLLLVLPRKYGLLEHLTHKSHTKQLLLHSNTPLMAIHPG